MDTSAPKVQRLAAAANVHTVWQARQSCTCGHEKGALRSPHGAKSPARAARGLVLCTSGDATVKQAPASGSLLCICALAIVVMSLQAHLDRPVGASALPINPSWNALCKGADEDFIAYRLVSKRTDDTVERHVWDTSGRDWTVQQVAAVLRPLQLLAVVRQHDAQKLFLHRPETYRSHNKHY